MFDNSWPWSYAITLTLKSQNTYQKWTRIGVFAQGQILCISPNGLQTAHCDAPHTPPPYFGWPKMNLDRISRHFRSILNFYFCHKMAAFWMTENHFRSHFSPFQINTQLCFLNIFQNGRRLAILEVRFPKNNRVLPLCVINGYAKYEVDRWIYDRVREPTSFFSFFIQNGRQRPFCFSDWCQRS